MESTRQVHYSAELRRDDKPIVLVRRQDIPPAPLVGVNRRGNACLYWHAPPVEIMPPYTFVFTLLEKLNYRYRIELRRKNGDVVLDKQSTGGPLEFKFEADGSYSLGGVDLIRPPYELVWATGESVRQPEPAMAGTAWEGVHAMGLTELPPPFPWFGGKSRIAAQVWERLGETPNYVEPFAGSAAMLFLRPWEPPRYETINDADGFVANFWRATRDDPEQVAHYADWPVNENDLHARHAWLVARKDSLAPRLEGDPDFYDAKIAGWWAWGICCWIGSGFCSGKGPWQVVEKDGVRQLANVGDGGQGVERNLAYLNRGQGVNRKADLVEYFLALADRLRRVRVCCGDWQRVCGPTPTVKVAQPTAMFLDPPYADTAGRDPNLYRTDSLSVAHEVRAWALEHGDDPRYRIALCGYEGEHQMPPSWSVLAWKTAGGYASQGSNNANRHRERIWFSPHCLKETRGLFDG